MILSFLPLSSTDPFFFATNSLPNCILHVFIYLFGKSIVFVLTAHRIMGKGLSKGAWASTSDYITKDIFKGLKLYEHI